MKKVIKTKKTVKKVVAKVKKVVKPIKVKLEKTVKKQAPIAKQLIKKVKEELKPIQGFDVSQCICSGFWDPNEFGEVVEFEGGHWHFKSDIQFEDGSIGPGLIRGSKDGTSIERKKKGVSFTMQDIKRNG